MPSELICMVLIGPRQPLLGHLHPLTPADGKIHPFFKDTPFYIHKGVRLTPFLTPLWPTPVQRVAPPSVFQSIHAPLLNMGDLTSTYINAMRNVIEGRVKNT